MNRYKLPTSIEIGGIEYKIYSDFRDILYIFEILNDPDLIPTEKAILAIQNFYEDDIPEEHFEEALIELYKFINCGEEIDDSQQKTNSKPLYDWEQDFNIIISPINRVIGNDVRGLDYLHWWTFMSAFMEIGECTFNTYVGIRDKLNKHKKLEKWEEKIYKENRDKIILKEKYDSTTQELIDKIMGKGV